MFLVTGASASVDVATTRRYLANRGPRLQCGAGLDGALAMIHSAAY
jgi:hypothetical protein